MFDKVSLFAVSKNISLFSTHEQTYQKLTHISSPVATNFFSVRADLVLNRSEFLVETSLM